LDTPESVAEAIGKALARREWKRAFSILEQGIVTLSRTPRRVYEPYNDMSPVALLRLSRRLLNHLEEAGIDTIGQLRLAYVTGKVAGMRDIGDITLGEIAMALTHYRPGDEAFRPSRRESRAAVKTHRPGAPNRQAKH